MIETLQEYVDARGAALRIDRERAVLHGVKILGVESRNGRTYLPAALAAAVGLYDGAKVNVNHPKGSPLAARDYQERIGLLREISARPEEGLFADFHFNPRHALAEQLLWDAEHAPENVGFSHNIEARTVRRGDRTMVEAILKVQGVDLVADPATTRGLFEAAGAAPLAELTLEALRQARPDLLEAILGEQAGELSRVQQELSRLQLEAALRQRREAACKLIRECGLPDPDSDDPWSRSLVGGGFLETLLRAADEPTMRRLIEERAGLLLAAEKRASHRLLAAGRAVSREQQQGSDLPPAAGAQRFAELLRSRCGSL